MAVINDDDLQFVDWLLELLADGQLIVKLTELDRVKYPDGWSIGLFDEDDHMKRARELRVKLGAQPSV